MRRLKFWFAAAGIFLLALVAFLHASREVFVGFGEGVRAASSTPALALPAPGDPDLPYQAPLPDPPAVIRAMYLTKWSAASPEKLASLLALAERGGVNAFVIDVKDYSGELSYAARVPLAASAGATADAPITMPNTLIARLHREGIYVIGRITVFQDPVLAKAHPEWALKNAKTGETWKDNHGLAWLDPAARPAWQYVADIARDMAARGFDEVNFDYVRFASDGNLADVNFPFWDEKTPRQEVIDSFFRFLRGELPHTKLSADIFGIATVERNDQGIGQIIEGAFPYFDYIAPMVYPSHFAAGFLGHQNPADYPYDVIKYSMSEALLRLEAYDKAAAAHAASSTDPAVLRARAKFRPWLQDFDLGARYTPHMVAEEIRAVHDALEAGSSSAAYGGWMLWDPTNTYHEVGGLSAPVQ